MVSLFAVCSEQAAANNNESEGARMINPRLREMADEIVQIVDAKRRELETTISCQHSDDQTLRRWLYDAVAKDLQQRVRGQSSARLAQVRPSQIADLFG